jgi:TolB protein
LNSGADVSPDGRLAALTLSLGRQVDLYLMALGASGRSQLTDDLAAESSPCWSPNGDRICYVSDKAGKPRLYVMPAGGGPSTPLLSEPDEAVSPDWSPVSNTICFATRLGGSYALATVDMADAGRNRKVLPGAAGHWESPSWAPDGRHVVCSHRGADGKSQLCMVDTWYGRLVPITQPADHTLPSWSNLH